MSEPLFVFCPVCRRHVKRGPDTTLVVTLQRHKASVHGLGGAAQVVAADLTGWEPGMTEVAGYAGTGWFCTVHDRFHVLGSYCQTQVEGAQNGPE